MAFVELHRYFARIKKDREATLNVGSWGSKIAGELSWSELLKERRVILLAEASSGKSEEFRNQQNQLSAKGEHAFFIRIEELADQRFEAALEPGSANEFTKWRNGTGEAYFFLDSIDEARLNRKSFETALKKFARDLDRATERARIFISCRVTDWKGSEDRAVVERLLPVFDVPQKEADGKDLLLDPIFNRQPEAHSPSTENSKRRSESLLVVQLVPLSREQCRTLAIAFGVKATDAFMTGIVQAGLDAFMERPGDVIDLVDYWKSYSQFGKLPEMIEHGITKKLNERDAYRADNDALTSTKAREGAERIAAALTLGKSFTLRAPGHDADPSLASGALDPALILRDWNDSERNALLRRGLFAPSTYGRIRFHHRSTQEYLTAQWLDRMLRANCPREEIWSLIFAERYGVETIVPSLRPAAAWLALRHFDIRDEVINREPLVLVRHGDPSSLPLEAKKRLLLSYARKHARAEVGDDNLDRRALWLFAERGLGNTIREAWKINTRRDFRLDILRMIREKAIKQCSDLAASIALDWSANNYERTVALEAVAECKDLVALRTAARQLIRRRKTIGTQLAASFARLLFPEHLTIRDLLGLIDKCRETDRSEVGGFRYTITDFYDACPNAQSRKEFVAGVSELCLRPPLVEKWQRISKRHFELAKNLGALAKREVTALRGRKSESHVVRLLMAIERVEQDNSIGDGPPLPELVRANQPLHRALFWADLEDHRRNVAPKGEQPIRIYQVLGYGTPLWEIGPTELPWLFDDLSKNGQIDDRRVALDAIISTLRRNGQLEGKSRELRKLTNSEPLLHQDLEEALKTHIEDESSRQRREEMERRRNKSQKEEEKAKASWVTFSDYLRTNFEQLRDPKLLKKWKTGSFRLHHLTQWLNNRTGHQGEKAARQWRLLEEGFGRQVAEAYRDGMKVLWRITKPENPLHDGRGGRTVKWTTILAHMAIDIEAAEDPDWTLGLSSNEAKRATLHGCLSEQGFPEWIEALIVSHPKVTLPQVRRTVQEEWQARGPDRSDFLYYYGRSDTIIPPQLHHILVALSASEPPELRKLDRGIRIFSRLDLTKDQKVALAKTCRRRLATHERKADIDRALRYLTLLLTIAPDEAADDLAKWLKGPKSRKDRRLRAEKTFAVLFPRRDPIVPSQLAQMSVAGLERILRLAYCYVRPEDDAFHDGSYTPNLRDDAEEARGTILNAIQYRSGAEAYHALRRAAAEPEYAARKERFSELAHSMAERDSELLAWNMGEVINFEVSHTAPVKTGNDLLRVVMSVLRNIQFQLDKGDVTSRPLLQKASDENEARNWITEQMNYRSLGRFHAYREAQVALGDRPDIIIASTTALCEVGMEVKHGGKKWTCSQLESALRVQLANDYLKPPSRRHGVFVVTNHGQRRWREPRTNKPIDFEKLISWLNSIASRIDANDSGPVQIQCFGVNAAPLV